MTSDVPAERTVESLLPDIAASGYLVNNLFQVDSGMWQANLRRKEPHTGAAAFAYGWSPGQALEAAYARMLRDHPPIPTAPPPKDETPAAPAQDDRQLDLGVFG